jgi:hypothetical protein
MGSEEQQRDALTAEAVAKRLEGKKIRVTYHASETVYYSTVVEAYSREEADNMYYGGEVDLEPTHSDHFETHDIDEEDI